MVKKLTRTGNSVALVLDRPLLKEAGIDPDSPVDVAAKDGVIVISPPRGKRRGDLRKIMAKVNRRYARVFKRLADS
jgi:antitoxin MazE